MINQEDIIETNDFYDHLGRKEKYRYLAKVLEQVETNLLYKGEVIEGNIELENQRETDIAGLKQIISDNLKADGIKCIIIQGKKLTINE